MMVYLMLRFLIIALNSQLNLKLARSGMLVKNMNWPHYNAKHEFVVMYKILNDDEGYPLSLRHFTIIVIGSTINLFPSFIHIEYS